MRLLKKPTRFNFKAIIGENIGERSGELMIGDVREERYGDKGYHILNGQYIEHDKNAAMHIHPSNESMWGIGMTPLRAAKKLLEKTFHAPVIQISIMTYKDKDQEKREKAEREERKKKRLNS